MANVTTLSRPGVGVIGNTADVISASDITSSVGPVHISSSDGTKITIDDGGQVMVPSTTSWTTSDGAYVTLDSTHSDITALKERVETLEKELAQLKKRRYDDLIKAELRGMGVEPTDDLDVNYFLRNLHKSLRVPKKLLGPSELNKLTIGTNDILVISVDSSMVPDNKKEKWLRRAKEEIGPLLDARGLRDRHIWVSTDKTGFSVIGVEESTFTSTPPGLLPLNELAPAKKKPRPPIMG
jgi:hypothetical protein